MSGDNGKGFPPFLGETLLANASVRLFGRLFIGLKIDATGIIPTSSSGSSRLPAPDNPLTAQLDPDRDPRLARIYGFSYQGIDFSIRIDITSGWLSDILLDPEMSDANNITGGVLADGSDGSSGLVG